MKSKKGMQDNIDETLELSTTKQYEARRVPVPVEERNIRSGPLKLHGEMVLERRLADMNARARFPGWLDLKKKDEEF